MTLLDCLLQSTPYNLLQPSQNAIGLPNASYQSLMSAPPVPAPGEARTWSAEPRQGK